MIITHKLIRKCLAAVAVTIPLAMSAWTPEPSKSTDGKFLVSFIQDDNSVSISFNPDYNWGGQDALSVPETISYLVNTADGVWATRTGKVNEFWFYSYTEEKNHIRNLYVPSKVGISDIDGWKNLEYILFNYNGYRIRQEIVNCPKLKRVSVYDEVKKEHVNLKNSYDVLPISYFGDTWPTFEGCDAMSGVVMITSDINRDGRYVLKTDALQDVYVSPEVSLLNGESLVTFKNIEIAESDTPLRVCGGKRYVLSEYLFLNNAEFVNIGRNIYEDNDKQENRRVYAPNAKRIIVDCPNFPELWQVVNLENLVISHRLKEWNWKCTLGRDPYFRSDIEDRIFKGCAINLQFVYPLYKGTEDERAELFKDFPKSIPDRAFEGCSRLHDFNKEFLARIENIGDRAFKGCDSLGISVPANVKFVGPEAFYTESEDAANNVTINQAEDNIILGENALYGVRGVSIRRNINSGLRVAGGKSNIYLYYMTKLPDNFSRKADSIIFGEGKYGTTIKEIWWGFEEYQGQSLILPNSLETISGISNEETNIELLEFGENIKDIKLFLSQTNTPLLHKLIVNATTPPNGRRLFDDNTDNAPLDASKISLCVPSAAYEAYRADDVWGVFFKDKKKLEFNPSSDEAFPVYFVGADNSQNQLTATAATSVPPVMLSNVKPKTAVGVGMNDNITLMFAGKYVAVEGADYEYQAHVVKKVTLNGRDITYLLNDGVLTLPALDEDSVLEYEYGAKDAGVEAVEDLKDFQAVEFYDLQGRQVTPSYKGLRLERSADGRMRKVVAN